MELDSLKSKLFGFLAVFLFAATAQAATVPALSVEELTDASDSIVVGEVVSVEAQLSKGYVVTTIFVAVEDVWKGEVIDMLRIRQRGGRVGNLATAVPGMPDFAVGERALLFLESRRSGRFVVTGLAQGKFAIVSAPDGTDVVFPAEGLHEAEAIQSVPRLGPVESLPTALQLGAETLDAIRARVAESEANR